jgi:hypothetical protein
MNHVLYQANQKAYEAIFLNTFITHALHPDRIAQCAEDSTSGRPTVVEYMKSVSHEINGITRKMIWNAHCRTVHLLARDGKDGAPFLDIHNFDSSPFSEYGPSNLFPVVEKLNASWHRTSSSPVMVQYTTKEYELGYQTSPLEDIDDFNNTVFRNINSDRALSTGRAIRLPTSRKRKGQNMPGAATREERTNIPRDNWLLFAPLDSTSGYHIPQSISNTPPDTIYKARLADVSQQPVAPLSSANSQDEKPYSLPTHTEELFDHLNARTSKNNPVGTHIRSIEYAEKVHPWRMSLVIDHKRRLTLKWGNPPQGPNRAVPNFKQAVAAAISMDILPPTNNYQKKVKAITAKDQHREHVKRFGQPQNKGGSVAIEGTTPELPISHDPLTDPIATLSEAIPDHQASTELTRLVLSARSKRKRKRDLGAGEQAPVKSSTKQKTIASQSCTQRVTLSDGTSSSAHQSPSPRPNRSEILEPNQHLPPNAYFEPATEDEQRAWRCSFKHIMGHYYNAGDRKSCRGCNTSLSDNIHVISMDFYMPPRSFYFQPAPDVRWKPSKQSSQPRKSDRPCHNAVAKDAYWEAINTGASEEEARQMAVDAVIEYIKPKPRPKKEPTPELTLEPEPNLGPHPSGSATMEHSQEIPDGCYWERRQADEKHAWRCDVNHALGRYYLAGDKKTCPGCGSCHNGVGKHGEMDFFLPSGVVVRQEAPGLSKYKPRRPYKLSKSSATSREPVTHNQMCTKVYFELVDEGYEAKEALKLAVERIDRELDKKQENKLKRQDERERVKDSNASRKTSTSSGAPRKDSANMSQAGNSKMIQYRRDSRGGCTIALIPKKRTANELSDNETDDVAVDQENGDSASEQDTWSSIESSSAEEDSSASESE